MNQRLLKRSVNLIRLLSKAYQENFVSKRDFMSTVFLEFIKNNFYTIASDIKRPNQRLTILNQNNSLLKNGKIFQSSFKLVFSNITISSVNFRPKKLDSFQKVSFIDQEKRTKSFVSKINKSMTQIKFSSNNFAIDPHLLKEEVLPLYLQEYLNRKLQQDSYPPAFLSELYKKNVTDDIFLKENLNQTKIKDILFEPLTFDDNQRTLNTSIKLSICPKSPASLGNYY